MILEYLEDKIQIMEKVGDWKEAIRIGAKPLLENDSIEDRYIDSMIEMCKKYNAYIVLADRFAMPHASHECGVKKMGVSLLVVKEPVDFLGKPVQVILTLAATIAITALDVSKKLVSRHSSGKLLYEFADVVLDMRGEYGDAAIQVESLTAKICPTSTIAAASLIQATLLRTVEKLVQKGITPDIRISANTDPGTAHNLELNKKYAHRIFRI